MRLTIDTLSALDACDDALETFASFFPRDLYPQGVVVTTELCARYSNNFDWDWAAERLLATEGWEKFADRMKRNPEHIRIKGDRDAIFNRYRDERTAFRKKHGLSDHAVVGAPLCDAYRQIGKELSSAIEDANNVESTADARYFAVLADRYESPNVARATNGKSLL